MYSTASIERHKDRHCEHIMPRVYNDAQVIMSKLPSYSHSIKVVSIHPVGSLLGRKNFQLA
jgi:hypothetical protein